MLPALNDSQMRAAAGAFCQLPGVESYMIDDISFGPQSTLDTTIFEQVIDHGPIEDRLALARQLCALVNDPETSAADRNAVMPALMRLACDRDLGVREILHNDLAQTDGLSSDLVFALVADEDDLAVKFTEANPSFTCNIQCAILTVGDPQRCTAIARREDVSAAAVRKIVNDGLDSAVIALLNNKAVRLGAGYCRKIYNRFHDQPKVCTALMDAPYLPAEIALVHNQRKADELRRSARLQGWVADFRSDDYISDNEENTALRILAEVPDDKMKEIVALMSARNMLTTSLLLRAGINGHLPFLEWALAYLGNVSLRRVRMATSRSSERVAHALLRRAGIPEDTHTLFLAICMVSSATGAAGQKADQDAFGRALVEVTMTRLAESDMDERQRVIQILSQFAQGRTRTLVNRLNDGYARVA